MHAKLVGNVYKFGEEILTKINLNLQMSVYFVKKSFL